MTAEEERAMVEDKSLPVWEVPGLPGPVVVASFGEYEPATVPVVRVFCSTAEHRDRPAVVSGRFRVPWWPEDREEHAAYCHTCARLAVFLGYFTPDHEWRQL